MFNHVKLLYNYINVPRKLYKDYYLKSAAKICLLKRDIFWWTQFEYCTKHLTKQHTVLIFSVNSDITEKFKLYIGIPMQC